MHTGQGIQTIGKTIFATSNIAVSSNGELVALGGRDQIEIWNFHTRQLIQKIDKFSNAKFHKHLETVRTVCFSPNGKYLLTAGEDGLVQFWDVNTGKNIHTLRGKYSILRFLLSQNGLTMVTRCRQNKFFEVWEIA